MDLFCEPDIYIGLLGSTFLLGIVIGCLTLTRLGDVYGRKPIYVLGIVMHICFMGVVLVTTSLAVAYACVFLFGTSLTARYYVGYTYNLETQPKSHQVLVSTTMFASEAAVYITVSLFFWQVSREWQLVQIPNGIGSFISLCALCLMPESPRWLVSEGRYDDARQVFRRIGQYNGKTAEELDEGIMQHKFDGELATPQPAVEAAHDSNKRGMKGAVLQSYTGSSSTQLRKDMRSSGNIVSQSFSVQQDILEDGAGGKAVM